MAISTDAAIEFYGTQDDVSNSSSSVVDGAFSVSGDVSNWTNDDDAPMAIAILECAYATAPDASSTVDLFTRLIDIIGTDDADAPDADNLHIYLGTFPLNNVTTRQHIPIEISLPNSETSQIHQFYIQNNGGQTMSASWQLHITPKAIGPHA